MGVNSGCSIIHTPDVYSIYAVKIFIFKCIEIRAIVQIPLYSLLLVVCCRLFDPNNKQLTTIANSDFCY